MSAPEQKIVNCAESLASYESYEAHLYDEISTITKEPAPEYDGPPTETTENKAPHSQDADADGELPIPVDELFKAVRNLGAVPTQKPTLESIGSGFISQYTTFIRKTFDEPSLQLELKSVKKLSSGAFGTTFVCNIGCSGFVEDPTACSGDKMPTEFLIVLKHMYDKLNLERIHLCLSERSFNHIIPVSTGYIMPHASYQNDLWVDTWIRNAVNGFLHFDLKPSNIVGDALIDWDNYIFQNAKHREFVLSDSKYYTKSAVKSEMSMVHQLLEADLYFHILPGEVLWYSSRPFDVQRVMDKAKETFTYYMRRLVSITHLPDGRVGVVDAVVPGCGVQEFFTMLVDMLKQLFPSQLVNIPTVLGDSAWGIEERQANYRTHNIFKADFAQTESDSSV